MTPPLKMYSKFILSNIFGHTVDWKMACGRPLFELWLAL